MNKYFVVGGFLLLVVITAAVFAQNKKQRPIYFDITGRNVGSAKIVDAAIQFDDFQFRWGGMAPYIAASYSDEIPRVQPKTVTLSWQNEVTGQHAEVSVPVPELPSRFSGKGYQMVNGRYQGEGLLLRFDIDSDATTACAVWTNETSPANDVRCR